MNRATCVIFALGAWRVDTAYFFPMNETFPATDRASSSIARARRRGSRGGAFGGGEGVDTAGTV